MPQYRCVRVYLTEDDADKLGEVLAKLATRLAQLGLEKLEPKGDGLEAYVRMKAGEIYARGGYTEEAWPEENEDEILDTIGYIEVCSDKKSYEELAAMLKEILESESK